MNRKQIVSILKLWVDTIYESIPNSCHTRDLLYILRESTHVKWFLPFFVNDII